LELLSPDSESQCWVSAHDHSFELVDRLRAGFDRGVLGQPEHAQHFDMPVAGLAHPLA